MIGKTKNLDPLYQIFEQSLATKSYEDSAKFTKELADSYLSYLDSTSAHVPFPSRPLVLEDLQAEAHEMLVKKMYGVVRVEDYRNYGKVVQLDGEEIVEFNFAPVQDRPAPSKKS